MRTRALTTMMAIVAIGALGACSAKTPPPPAPSPPPAPAAPAQPAEPAAPPAAEAPPPPPAEPAVPAAPAPPAPVHFSPSDYGPQERRINALINNAESRDTSGETQYVAEEGYRQREHCTTRACILHAYAAEEAHLRKWEGSGDIK
jgi:hypothetical protein